MLAGGEATGTIMLPTVAAHPAIEPVLATQSFYRLANALSLEGDEWHSIVLAVPRLFEDTTPAQGLEIERISFLPA